MIELKQIVKNLYFTFTFTGSSVRHHLFRANQRFLREHKATCVLFLSGHLEHLVLCLLTNNKRKPVFFKKCAFVVYLHYGLDGKQIARAAAVSSF